MDRVSVCMLGEREKYRFLSELHEFPNLVAEYFTQEENNINWKYLVQ